MLNHDRPALAVVRYCCNVPATPQALYRGFLDRAELVCCAAVAARSISRRVQVDVEAEAAAKAFDKGLEVWECRGDQGPAQLDLLADKNRDDTQGGCFGVDVIANKVEVKNGDGGDPGGRISGVSDLSALAY
jgi:hypothetical protein